MRVIVVSVPEEGAPIPAYQRKRQGRTTASASAGFSYRCPVARFCQAGNGQTLKGRADNAKDPHDLSVAMQRLGGYVTQKARRSEPLSNQVLAKCIRTSLTNSLYLSLQFVNSN